LIAIQPLDVDKQRRHSPLQTSYDVCGRSVGEVLAFSYVQRQTLGYGCSRVALAEPVQDEQDFCPLFRAQLGI
jgi:hypothetical protein